MSPTILLTLAVVAAAGAALAVQAPINATLGRVLGGTVAAACVSFGVGFAALLAVTLATSGPQPLARLAQVSPGLLVGGLFGAFFVWAMLWAVPVVGALTAFAALVGGQLGMALLLDATGAFGLPVQEVSLKRIAALALVGAGLILSRL
jgi:transporter family-2 protein